MEVYKGRTIDEVVELLGKYTQDAKIISGGTDIVIALRNEKVTPKALIDISSIDELKTIKYEGEFIKIGAGVTFTQIVENPLFHENLQGLYKACSLVGSPQIRNKGTIGGNIANGSPAADSIPPLICLDSTIALVSKHGKRKVLLEDYYKDKANCGIKEDELLVDIEFRRPMERQVLNFAKLGLRKALAISRISMATFLELDQVAHIKNIRVASGSLGKYPMRELELEKYLVGKPFHDDVVDEGVKVLQQCMDRRLAGRTTLPYKRIAVERMLREALEDGTRFLNGVSV